MVEDNKDREKSRKTDREKDVLFYLCSVLIEASFFFCPIMCWDSSGGMDSKKITGTPCINNAPV